jgi:ribonuclease P/MRP protein subunit POP5
MPTALPPTLREKNRYVAFELISDGRFDKKDVSGSISRAFFGLFGEKGGSEANLWLIDWEKERSLGILKVAHRSLDSAMAALATLNNLGGEKVIVHVLGISGTLKSARKKYIS